MTGSKLERAITQVKRTHPVSLSSLKDSPDWKYIVEQARKAQAEQADTPYKGEFVGLLKAEGKIEIDEAGFAQMIDRITAQKDAEIERLKSKIKSDTFFYDLVVKARDYERTRADTAQAKLTALLEAVKAVVEYWDGAPDSAEDAIQYAEDTLNTAIDIAATEGGE